MKTTNRPQDARTAYIVLPGESKQVVPRLLGKKDVFSGPNDERRGQVSRPTTNG